MAGGYSKQYTSARAIIQPMLDAGASGAKILNQLRLQGVGYRSQDFYRDMRRARDEISTNKTFHSIGFGETLTSVYKKATNPYQYDKFMYRMYDITRDPITGEVSRRYYSVSSPTELTRGDLIDRAHEMHAKRQGKYRHVVTDSILYRVDVA